MTKILHVLEQSLPRLAGYTIRSKYIVDNQRKEGLEPVVVTSPLHGNGGGRLKDFEEIDSIRYFRTGEFNKLKESDPLPVRLLKRYAYSKSYCNAIQWVAEKESVQIVHSHSSYLNGIRGNEAARRLGIPSVYEVRGLWQDTATVTADIDTGHWKYRFINYMERKAMSGAGAVVAISERLREDLVMKGVSGDKIYIVPNGVDTHIFKPVPKHKELVARYGLDNRIVFGFIGSIRRIEGLSLFLECLPEIIARHNAVSVLLVGGGDEVSRLREIVDKRGLDDHVIFTGAVNHDQILDYYSIIDVFVYPRIDARVNHKVTPLKPLEAMAMEKTVIASDVGGLKELVQDNATGILFRADDGGHLVERCLSVIGNPQLRRTIAENARSWTVRERDWTNVIKLYNSVYADLLDFHKACI